MMKEYMCQKER